MSAELRVETGDADGETVVAQWFYADGALVAEGAVVCSIMVEKAAYDIAAPLSGRLKIMAAQDEVVRPGDVVGEILQQ